MRLPSRSPWCAVVASLSLSILSDQVAAQEKSSPALSAVDGRQEVSRQSGANGADDAATRKTPHRFFDSTNIVLTGVESGALLADGITTQHLLKTYGGRETDPIARVFVNAGWPGQIAGGAIFVSADVGLRYLLHRKNHHRLERWIPLILTAYGAAGALHNARYY